MKRIIKIKDIQMAINELKIMERDSIITKAVLTPFGIFGIVNNKFHYNKKSLKWINNWLFFRG